MNRGERRNFSGKPETVVFNVSANTVTRVISTFREFFNFFFFFWHVLNHSGVLLFANDDGDIHHRPHGIVTCRPYCFETMNGFGICRRLSVSYEYQQCA